MNDSNAVRFTVTAQPLPVSWLDQDVGVVGLAGSAGYANGAFTVAGGGGRAPFVRAGGVPFSYSCSTGGGGRLAGGGSVQGHSAPGGKIGRVGPKPRARHLYLVYH